MTQELYEKCKQWEQQFRWSCKSSFLHMTNREFGEIAELYKEAFNETLTQAQMTCNTCRLKAMVRLGNDYFAYQQQLAEEEKNKRLENQEVKPKSGRKKKVDID